MHPWMGAVFFRGGDPYHIEQMTYTQLKYWNGWHEIMTAVERRPVEK